MLKKTYPEFEALKKNNPWKFIFENQSDEDIRQHVVDWDWQFVHPKDKDIILNHDNDKKVKELNKFVLHKLPKPYRGNLKDPKLVILSLNPGFNDRVNRVLFNMLAPKYQLEFIDLSRKNLLLADGCRIITNELDDVLDNGYWTRQLSDIAEKNKAYLDKIGLMQYIPYASKNFESWEGADKLETQLFTQKIIHHLLHETDTLFLIMRSKERWEKLIGENEMKENKERFLYNRNPRCQKLSQRNLKDENGKDQFGMILDALSKD